MQLTQSNNTHNLSSVDASSTICALATPAGGAIAVIRLSGNDAINIVDKVFVSKSNHRLTEAKPQTLHFGHLTNQDGEVIDEVLVSIFRSPHSYTGENAVEISCHGSQYVISQILKTFIQNGCRQANPGEYTQRAFMNGKMDLSQAEAVADLIASTNRATHQMAMSQLKGHFSDELALLRNQLLKITSLLELELDFSDHEELEFADRTELLDLAQTIDQRLSTLARSFETGKAYKQGVAVAIVGKTNVGKSTLLNQLLKEEKAIVSNIHGTTRDVIEDTTEIKGVTFRFIDTAGIRSTNDEIERLGIERTYKKLNEARIILWLVDEQPSRSEIQEMLEYCEDKQVILVQNKIDIRTIPDKLSTNNLSTIQISAKLGTNIDQLENLLYQKANIPEITENDVIITSARHYDALIHAKDSITRVINGLKADFSGDLIAEDLRVCLDQLADITGGQITTPEVLENIFKHFCIGK